MSFIRPATVGFWRKNTVPSRRVKLNIKDPLSSNILAFFVPYGPNGFVDLCGNLQPLNPQYGAYPKVSPMGPGLYVPPGSASNVNELSTSIPEAFFPSYGAIVGGGYFSAIEEYGGYPYITSIVSSNNTGNNLPRIGSSTYDNPVPYYYSTPSDKTITITSQSTPFTANFAATWNPIGCAAFMNGKFVASTYSGNITYSTGATFALGGGNNSNGAIICYGIILGPGFTNDQLRNLTLEPFSILDEEGPGVLYYVPSNSLFIRGGYERFISKSNIDLNFSLELKIEEIEPPSTANINLIVGNIILMAITGNEKPGVAFIFADGPMIPTITENMPIDVLIENMPEDFLTTNMPIDIIIADS